MQVSQEVAQDYIRLLCVNDNLITSVNNVTYVFFTVALLLRAPWEYTLPDGSLGQDANVLLIYVALNLVSGVSVALQNLHPELRAFCGGWHILEAQVLSLIMEGSASNGHVVAFPRRYTGWKRTHVLETRIQKAIFLREKLEEHYRLRETCTRNHQRWYNQDCEYCLHGNEDVLLAIRIEHALSRKADLERLAMLIYVGPIIVFGGAYVFLRLTTPSEVIHNHPQLHRWIGEDGIAKRIWNSLSHRMAVEL
ncbi:hypothetical protein CYMTET_55910 [Cymbomonas tetramitiformis]|uniref:Uncharacterized protein n=1 Tax=Cymbomonas tetramitiformis TaxID=36881 RepID=A0AAE0BC00_9CHLO|nr:hypothetical protein CYMTET_55910 [Cymbomonas tetramitiformis]